MAEQWAEEEWAEVPRRPVAQVGQVVSCALAEPVASAAVGRWAWDVHWDGEIQENAGLQPEREAVDAAVEDKACARWVFHRHSVWQEVRRDARSWAECFFRAVDRREVRSARAEVAGRRVRASVDDRRLAACAPVAWENWAACSDCVDCFPAS